MTNAYNNISKLNISNKTKNKAKTIQNIKATESMSIIMILNRTKPNTHIYIYTISFPCSMLKY